MRLILAAFVLATSLLGCGSGQPCSGASCSGSCTPNQVCTPTSVVACKTYATVCAGAEQSCKISGDSADGTGCGTDHVCSAGTCVAACVPNVDCTPATRDACTVYRTACDALGIVTTCKTATAADGSPCAGGQVCQAGACVPAFRTVSSTLQTTYVVDDGTETIVNGWPDLESGSARVTALLTPDSSATGYTVFPVTVGGDSKFSVPNVPAGRYFIQIDLTVVASQVVPSPGGGSTTNPIAVTERVLYEASPDDPDLSIMVSSRHDRVGSTQSTPVSYALSGLSPWSPDDAIRIASSQVAIDARLGASSFNPRPATGDTTISATSDWQFTAPWLPASGDTLWIWQRGPTPIGSGAAATTFTKPTAFTKLNDVSMTDGSGGTISAVLAPVIQSGSLSADFRLSQFAALARSVNPSAVPSDAVAAVVAVPHTLAFPDEPLNALPGRPGSIDVDFASLTTPQTLTSTAFVTVPNPTSDTTYGSLSYGQFLGALWQEAVMFTYLFDVPLSDGSTISSGGAYRAFVPASTQPGAIAPVLGPPAAPAINGHDAFITSSGVTTQPVFSWAPPAVGTATKYVVNVHAQTVSPNPGDLVSISAVVHDAQSFRMPAAFMHSGVGYVGSIWAVNSPGTRTDPVLRIGSPTFEMNCMFGVFSP